MVDLSSKCLLMIEPKSKIKEESVKDKYTANMNNLLTKATKTAFYKGWHTCACGERSGNAELTVSGYVTNSLAVHYLEFHRSEVPATELEKLDKIIL